MVESYPNDVAYSVLTRLDDVADIIRVAAVSRSWRNFVINNGISKKLCLKKAPTLSIIDNVVDRDEVCYTLNGVDGRNPERDHTMYSYLLRAMSMDSPTNCIDCIIGASSTNIYPMQSLVNVMVARDKYIWGVSYWSSKGQRDPNILDYTQFRLQSKVCVVNEIQIRHSEAFWEPGTPVYSAKSVRFQMGHPKYIADFNVDYKNLSLQQLADHFVWTYTSPEFPMTQESCLQSFKLPEPTICIGGFFKIEFLGITQKKELDDLFYLCMGEIRILGRPLGPAFDIQICQTGDFSLIYWPENVRSILENPIKSSLDFT
ncbi:hypothetical protein ACJIZ3_013934 [Penstemon smallii]|uniref:F-box domain-containing protein n=1 Tax=Penstemon smallii TaxID=265156 RepID=A0ABD3RPV1_9LAMI